MISYLKGAIVEALPHSLVLDVHGVGYEVKVPLSTFDAIKPEEGRVITIKTHLHLRENIQQLYGFATDEERDIFRLLIERVSGIGPSTALSLLSGLSVADFKSSVIAGDVARIARARGVGKKTAERIILELKDKVGLADAWQAQQNATVSSAALDSELALIALGFKQTEARKVIASVLKQSPDLATDELIRAALRSMS